MCILYVCTMHHTLAVQSKHNVSFSLILSSPISDHRLHNNNQKRSVQYNICTVFVDVAKKNVKT